MKENFGIGGVAAMQNRSDFFPRFGPVPPRKQNLYTRVTYTPGGYYCEKWEYLPPEDSLENKAKAVSEADNGNGRANPKTELLVDLFFLICVGLFVLTFLWAQGLLA